MDGCWLREGPNRNGSARSWVICTVPHGRRAWSRLTGTPLSPCRNSCRPTDSRAPAVRSAHPLSNSDRLLVAHAVSLISIALEKPARVVDAEQRLRTAVTREMLRGPAPSTPACCGTSGSNPNGDVVVVSLDGAGPVLAAEQDLGRVLVASGPYLMAPIDEEVVIVVSAAGSRRRIAVCSRRLDGPRGGMSQPMRFSDLDVGWNRRASPHARAVPATSPNSPSSGLSASCSAGAVQPNYVSLHRHWIDWPSRARSWSNTLAAFLAA